jgi:putative ABC transport system substrate-binding protein
MKKYLHAGIILCLILSPSFSLAGERAVISVIFSSNAEPYQQSWKGFKKFLDEKRVALWVSQHNLEKDEPKEICRQIDEKKPDIVFALGAKAAKFAKEKIKDIPVVFGMVFDPDEFVGPNITGGSLKIPARRKLEEIKRILPGAKKLGMLYSPDSIALYKEVSKECVRTGFQLVARKVDSQKELPDAVKDISWQIDCFLMIPDPAIYFPKSVEHLLREGLEAKCPVIGLSLSYTKAGALASFDCDYNDLGRQAGELALRILDGVKTSRIPVFTPRKIDVSLNLITAERIGIEIPHDIIEQASKVFKR